MSPPLTHDEFRKRVCGLCWVIKKNNTQSITLPVLQAIRDHQYEGYSLANNALPTVICDPCRKRLIKCKKVRYLILCMFVFISYIICRIQISAQLQTWTTPHWQHPLFVLETLVTDVTVSFVLKEDKLWFPKSQVSIPSTQSSSVLAVRVSYRLV